MKTLEEVSEQLRLFETRLKQEMERQMGDKYLCEKLEAKISTLRWVLK